MKKATVVPISILAIVAVVVLVFAAARLRLSHLKEALSAETDVEAAASIARTIMKSHGARGIAVVRQYVKQHENCALDATHKLLLLCDKDNGKIHIVYVGPEGKAVSTGDAALDEAITAAIPETTGETMSIGEPAKLFKGVHLLAAEEGQAEFVLKPKMGNEWYRVLFRFSDGRLTSQGLHEVNNTELGQWRTNQNWPKSWQ